MIKFIALIEGGVIVDPAEIKLKIKVGSFEQSIDC